MTWPGIEPWTPTLDALQVSYWDIFSSFFFQIIFLVLLFIYLLCFILFLLFVSLLMFWHRLWLTRSRITLQSESHVSSVPVVLRSFFLQSLDYRSAIQRSFSLAQFEMFLRLCFGKKPEYPEISHLSELLNTFFHLHRWEASAFSAEPIGQASEDTYL